MTKKKQLTVRNTRGGMIWQVYHVITQFEVDMLTNNARKNGFLSVEVTPDITNDETWPGWRDTEGWQQILHDAGESK